MIGEFIPERRREEPNHLQQSGFPVPKLELPMFEGTKHRWWVRRCEKLFEIHQVAERQRVWLASACLPS